MLAYTSFLMLPIIIMDILFIKNYISRKFDKF